MMALNLKKAALPVSMSVAAVMAAAILLPGAAISEEAFAQTSPAEIKIAFLSDFHHKGIFNYAVETFNAEQNNLGGNYQITSTIRDISPSNVTTVLADLHSNGYQYFMGPLTSSAAEQAVTFSDRYDDVVLLSPTSTATGLAHQDSLFRLVPNDSLQALKIAAYVGAQGTEHVVIIYRNDTWGQGLRDDIIGSYGGSVARQILLHTEGANAASVAGDAAGEVSRLVSAHGADSVGVILLSFEPDTFALINHILSDQTLSDTLGDVRWYGADGIAQNENIRADSDVAGFFNSVNFAASKFEANPNAVNDALGALTFEDNASFRDNVYDAVFLLADTVIVNFEERAAGVAGSTVKSLMRDVANGLETHPHHHSERTPGDGALGKYALDENGDMNFPPTFAQFGIFEKSDGSFEWRIIRANVCR